MFFGREVQMGELKSLWRKRTSSLVVVSGRRRIGKSTLVEKFAAESSCAFVEIAGLAPDKDMTNEKQLANFCERLSVQTSAPVSVADGWPKAFDALFEATRKADRLVIFLDEISWMGRYDTSFAAYLKNAWDIQFSKRPNLVFVLAGSVSSWIHDNIQKSRGFVGRISLDMVLGELTLGQSRRFWGELAERTSVRDVLDMLSITGGVPKYLEEIDPALTVAENVRKLCFTPDGYLFKDFDSIFSDVFGESTVAKRTILTALAAGPASVSEIAERTELDLNGRITDELRDLTVAGFVAAANGLNPSTGKPVREVRYRLRDNYMRFYLKYIEPRKTAVEDGLYRFADLESLAGWETTLGLQFENLILNNLSSLAPHLGLGRSIVTSAAPYARRGGRKGGVQVDLLVQTEKSVCLVEIKRRKRIGVEIEEEVRSRLSKLGVRRGVSKRTALVYDGVLAPEVIDGGYFDFIVPAAELLNA